jgi:signal transduction histidine kinase
MTESNNEKPRILVVDDVAENLHTLINMLSDEYAVVAATSGKKALELAARVPLDLILLDVMMPDMNGFETCQHLRSDPRLRDIPVIFISALDAVHDKVKAFQVGGSDYVTKPFQPEEVRARILTHVTLYSALRKLYQREESLRSNLVELGAAHASLKDMGEQLLQSEKRASIGQLAAGMAHEINNPIGFVNSNLGTLQHYLVDLLTMLSAYEQSEGEVTPETRAALAELKQNVELSCLREDQETLLAESLDGLQWVKRIVQDLQCFSHVGETEQQWASLEKGMDSTLNVMWSELKYKVKVVKEYGGIPDIECIPSQLNQVFMSLLINAAQSIEAQGQITIRTGQDEQNVWVEVADTGRGIKLEHLNRIFEPFFTTRQVGAGKGLGLSLSYGIVSKHNGRIEVKSEVGTGSTFRVWLPIRQPVAV